MAVSTINILKNIVKIREGNQDVNEESLREIKAHFKTGSASPSEAYIYLFQTLKRSKNIHVRMRALFMIDYLFCRSSTFRIEVCENMKSFYDDSTTSATLLDHDEKLRFNDQICRLIELWDLKYGKDYTILRSVARYLRESLKLNNVDVISEAQHMLEEAENRKHKQYADLTVRRQQIFSDYAAEANEIRDCISMMHGCFNLLFPSILDDEPSGSYRPTKMIRLQTPSEMSSSFHEDDFADKSTRDADQCTQCLCDTADKDEVIVGNRIDNQEVDENDIAWEDNDVKISSEDASPLGFVETIADAGLGSSAYNLV